jgi:sulfatase modifying factor 1
MNGSICSARLARLRNTLLTTILAVIAGCSQRDLQRAKPLASAAPVSALDATLAQARQEPVPRGMAWIEPGPLVVGTPPNVLPRRPDRELAGEQFVLHGYYMDVFPYPNEEGAIAMTGVSHSEARALCAKLDKRLCTEIEWERACKGPAQHTYEYGNSYREDACGTGVDIMPRPNGIRVGCQSDFGVHDLHGGAFEWTASRFMRGSVEGKMVLRGGNDVNGEIVGRCANAEMRGPGTKSPSIGFRCCVGPVNDVDIVMRVEHGPPVSAIASIDSAQTARFLAHLPPTAPAELPDSHVDAVRAWIWRPVGNERLDVLSLCQRRRIPQQCTTLVGRDTPGQPVVLALASTGYFPSQLYVDDSPRDIWIIGNDGIGPFRRLMHYDWGRLDVGAKERQTSLSAARPKRKGRRTRQ